MKSFIDLQDYADPTGNIDAAQGLIQAATNAQEGKLRLIGEGIFRLDSLVDLRGVHIDMPCSTFNITHSDEVGIIIGGNASSTENPHQSLGVINSTDDNADKPTVRIIGAKCQHIYIQSTKNIQIYANNNNRKDYSSAYSTMTFIYAEKINFLGVDGGWINENQFFLNRTHKIIMEGDYNHNHNKFYSGTMEGAGEIDLKVGRNNHFIGFRFERDPANTDEILRIYFGKGTFSNNIEASWQSSSTYTNIPYSGEKTIVVDDMGSQNTIRHTQESVTNEICLLDLSEGTPRVSSFNAPSLGFRKLATDLRGVYSIEHLIDRSYKLINNYSCVFESELIPVSIGDCIAFDSELKRGIENTNAFRPRVYAYDENKNLITDIDFTSNSPVSGSSMHWFNDDKFFSPQANLKSGYVIITDDSNVKYIRFFMVSGNNTAGIIFNHLRVVSRQFKRATHTVRNYHSIHEGNRINTIFYDSDINMLKVGKGISCYSYEMNELYINICRSDQYIVSISENNVTLDVVPDYINTGANAKLVYQSSETTEPVALDISTVNANVISLTKKPPEDIMAGSPISVIVTKLKSNIL